MTDHATRRSLPPGEAAGSKHLPALFGLLTALAMLAYPVLFFAVRGGMDWTFSLLALLSLYGLARYGAAGNVWDRPSVAYAAAMASWMLALTVSEIAHARFMLKPYDNALALVFTIPVYQFARRIGVRTLATVQYGFCLGAITAAAVLHWAPKDWGNGRPGSYFLNPIHYGDVALVTGVLAFFSIDWTGTDSRALRALKTLALIAGLYASLRTGSRGGWIAIPAFIALWLYKQRGKFPRAGIAVLLAALIGLSLAAYAFLPWIHHRIADIYTNLAAYRHGHENTAVGIRFQIWKAALLLWRQHPLFGVGPGYLYKEHMHALGQIGYITPMAAQFGVAEVHNQVLAVTVKLGIAGLVSVLSLYAVPFALFARSANSPVGTRRVGGVLGMALVIGFFIYGLTVETFDLKMTAVFYGMTVAILLAAASHRPIASDAAAGAIPADSSGSTDRPRTH